METEKLKKNKIEDRISDLPDAIIQHILSFLPSTEEVIQTSVLSKRWRNQWTRVPVLIFDSLGMSYEKFLKFIDNTLLLHDCSKIHKFNLRYRYSKDKDPQFADRIFFATKKHVEKLILSSRTEEFLPEFLFNYASLVKLRTYQFNFMHNVKLINWGCLSSLKIAYCVLPYQAMEHILFGIPSLKSLKLISCAPQKIVIASKSLKKLFIHSSKGDVSVLEISCPNLEKLSLKRMLTDDTQMISQAIDNVLSSCLLLESFELSNCVLDRKLVIASKSLKKFVLCDSYEKFDIEISCPLLEELKLLGYLNVKTAKLLNLPSSLSATIDFDRYGEQKTCESLVIEILQQLQHIKDLKIGSCFLQILSKVGARFSPVFNIKCLTVSDPHLIEHHSGIAHLLRNSPVLEKLVISVLCCKGNHIRKNYWYSNADVFNCLISHLKTIKIMGFPERIGRREHMLNFIKFLLENARVLDKMVVLLGDHIEISPSDLSQELLSLPRCSRKTIIEVIRSNSNKEKVKFL